MRTRNCVSRPTLLGLAFKLIEEAEKTWRRVNGAEKIKLLLEGVPFKDGEPVQGSLSLISCLRHNMSPRSDYASQTEDPAGRVAGNSR